MIRLSAGSTYTWTFTYLDGIPQQKIAGMGEDVNADSLIWQIHGYEETNTPCTTLNFQNGTQGLGGPQMWAFHDCNGIVWTGTYTPGETDRWEIVANISESSSGYVTLYRNGVLVAHATGATYHDSAGDPWWNVGPYKWRWELPNGGGSSMSSVGATISNLVVTGP